MDSLSELKTQFQLERQDLTNKLAAKDREIAELKSKLALSDSQVQIATKGEGIPEHLLQDVQRRQKMGLSLSNAIDCARRQWDNDIKNSKATEKPEQAKAVETPISTPAPVAPVEQPKGKGTK